MYILCCARADDEGSDRGLWSQCEGHREQFRRSIGKEIVRETQRRAREGETGERSRRRWSGAREEMTERDALWDTESSNKAGPITGYRPFPFPIDLHSNRCYTLSRRILMDYQFESSRELQSFTPFLLRTEPPPFQSSYIHCFIHFLMKPPEWPFF